MHPPRTATALAGALAVLLAGGASFAVPATAASGATMSVSKATVLVGTKEHFSGHVSSGGKRRIVLQRKSGSSWRSLAVHHSASSGDYKFAFIPAAPGHPTFRVVATTSKGVITATSTSRRVTVLAWHYLSDLQSTANDGHYDWHNGAVEVNGHSYVHSVYFDQEYRAGDNRYLEYNLARKCRSLRSVFGITDDSDASTPVDFAVSADGSQLYATEQSLGESVTKTVDIAGHLRLRISATLPSDDPDIHNGVQAVFGNAEILCSF